MQELKKKIQKALVIRVSRRSEDEEEVESSLAEMKRLATTLGLNVVHQEVQSLRSPSKTTYLGAGKIEEILAWLEDHEEVDLVLVDDELSPRQNRALEMALKIEVLDRTGVILEIFEDRAQTREARIEVEIARLRYELPRQRDQGGGDDRRGGGGRGERGHTNVELSKVRIRERIARLEAELQGVEVRADLRRDRRSEAFQVALVGYTNAGKSSLMRGLTGSEVYVEDQLFATLGTTVRRLHPEATPPILIADTVGFIKNLPHQLVASFRSTLAEAREADWLLLVVDASDPQWRDQLEVTRETLESIGAKDLPVSVVLNKMDLLEEEAMRELREENPEASFVSALERESCERLRMRLIEARDLGLCEETFLVPYAKGRVAGAIHESGRVMSEEHVAGGTILKVRGSVADLDRWRLELSTEETVIEEPTDLVALAGQYGLQLDSWDEDFDTTGLDFRVVHGVDEEGDAWILRSPRRPAVFAASRVEGRVLRLLGERLEVEVPRFSLHTREVIAYRRLEGTPAWTVQGVGDVTWNGVDPEELSEGFADSLGRFLAELQSVPKHLAIAAGAGNESMEEVREARRKAIQMTREALQPSDAVVRRWEAWLERSEGWPEHTALIHGDLHPGHLILDPEGSVAGVLDWTEAKVSDPARDFIAFYGCFDREGLEQILEAFAAAGGRTWPGMESHIIEDWAFRAVETAKWAIQTGQPEVLAYAKQLLQEAVM